MKYFQGTSNTSTSTGNSSGTGNNTGSGNSTGSKSNGSNAANGGGDDPPRDVNPNRPSQHEADYDNGMIVGNV